jgi:uncharacterized iron-regulated membrane protein
MSAAPRYRFRRLLAFVHRWTGLTLGLAIVLLGLTGTVAGFWREIDRTLRPEMRVEAPAGQARQLGIDEVLAIVKRAHPQRPKPWTIEMPYDEHAPFNCTYSRPEEKGLKYSTNLHVAVNPYTGEILSQWYWGETLVTWVYDLHAAFQAGLTGHEVVGWLGLVLIVFSLIGLYVWWPVGRFAKRHFLVKTDGGASRLELDLHRAAGFYSLILMLVLGLTGYMFVFPSHIAALVSSVSTLAQPTPTSIHGGNESHGTGSGSHDAKDTRYLHSTPREGVTPLTAGQALERALQVFPEAKLVRLYSPAGPTGVYGVIMRHPTEIFHKTYPNTEVWLDQYDGSVLVTSDPRKASAGQKFLDLALPLHNGEAAGLTGRIVIGIAGIVPLLLFITGLLQWLRRRRLATSAGRRADALPLRM